MSADVGSVALSRPSARQAMTLPKMVGFFFSFRLFTVLLSVRFLQLDPQTGVAINIVLNLLLLTIVGFYSMGPAPSTLMSTFRVRSVRWVIVFLGLSFFSLFWTAAISVPAAFAYWCAMAADVLMVVLLLRGGPETEVAASVMEGYVIGACCIAVVAWLLPAQSDLRLGDEELLGPNQIGYACAFAVFLAQYLMSRGAGNWKVASGFLAITLLRTLSKTTLVAFMAGESILLVQDKSISRRTKLTLAALTGLVILVFSRLLSAYYEIYINAGNQAETLTGRLGIWAIILDKALDQPWIGHGFHSVWKVIPPFGPDQFEPRHAHNELLQQFYAYGLAGVVLLVALYRSFYREIRKLSAGPEKTVLVALFVFVIVRGLADTEAFDLSLPLWAITLIGVTLTRTSPLSAIEKGEGKA
jgi:exopolysaccharide production protein ExoQ